MLLGWGSPSVHLKERIDLPISAAVPHQALAGDVELERPVDTRTFKAHISRERSTQRTQTVRKCRCDGCSEELRIIQWFLMQHEGPTVALLCFKQLLTHF